MRGQLFLGVDAGGTHCRARLVDDTGEVLGYGQSGPANLTIGVQQAHRSIMAATAKAFAAAKLGRPAMRRTHAGIGVAGLDDPALARRIAACRFPFATLAIRSDAVIACLGAHGEDDGAILILGTGSQGIVRTGRCFRRVGGWGFMLSDQGSAAVIGHAAVRQALLAHEGVITPSTVTRRIMRRFGNDPAKMLAWSRQATPGQWGEFCPLVFAGAEAGDPVAAPLMAWAIGEVAELLERMVELGGRRIALVGGLAELYAARLPRRLARRLVPAREDALAGAIDLARRSIVAR
jgi:glucosamine kinase